MTITIKDVAKRAGVAPSTVSRVIANNNRISQATKEKVFQVMEDMGYHPNYNARSLAVKTTETIGIIMPRSAEATFQNPFFPEVIRGINVAAHKYGYSILMSTGSNEEEEQAAVTKMVQGKRVDGVILLSARVADPLIKQLQDQSFPFVVIGKPLGHEDVHYVDNDNVKASYEATKYLLSLGHRRIGYVLGSLEFVVSLDRLDGYQQALAEEGQPFERSLIVQEPFLREGGYHAVETIFDQTNPPTAMLVADDVMTFGVMNALKDLGYQIPEDIAIVSFNNVQLAEVTSPPLTSVDIGIYELGYRATEMLLKQIKNEDDVASYEIVPTKLIVRQSCGGNRKET